MKLSELINGGKETISVLYPEREAKEIVYAYLENYIGTKRHTHIIDPEYSVPSEKAGIALEAFHRMASGEPLQYITGKAWFYGREFNVTPDVLIPRPETEILCSNVLKTDFVAAAPKVLDLCTGSGCIAWTLSLEMPRAEVTAVDISEAAIKVASSQDFAEELSIIGATAPKFFRADILQDVLPSEVAGVDKFDVIVSNPPYVMDSEKALMRTNVLDHEPHLALFVPDDDPLVFYRAVARHAARHLTEQGFGIVEINEALGEETADVFRNHGFVSYVLKDLHDKDRFVCFSYNKCRE